MKLAGQHLPMAIKKRTRKLGRTRIGAGIKNSARDEFRHRSVRRRDHRPFCGAIGAVVLTRRTWLVSAVSGHMRSSRPIVKVPCPGRSVRTTRAGTVALCGDGLVTADVTARITGCPWTAGKAKRIWMLGFMRVRSAWRNAKWWAVRESNPGHAD